MAGSLDIILGVPGAGKTEQANRLAASHGYVHLSTGQLLRNNADPKLKAVMTSGQLAPSQDTEELLLSRMTEIAPHLSILLDGFPRTKDEIAWLDDTLPQLDRQLGHVFYLDVPKAEAQARLVKRGREDDVTDVLNQRWAEFSRQTEPVIRHYRHQLIKIDGTGTPEQVAARIVAAL